MLGTILGWLGGGVLKSILGEITSLEKAKLASTTELEKAKLQSRIDELRIKADQERDRLADVDSARKAAQTYPRWMAVLGFMVGFPFALHLLLVGVATSFAPLISGGWLDWMLHIPKLPTPLDASEIGIIAFFFGGMVGVSIAGAIGKAVSKK